MSEPGGWARNLLANYGGAGFRLAVLFLLTPLVVHRLGVTLYGLWVLAHSVTFYLGFLDLGLYQTLVKSVAESSETRDRRVLHRTLSTTLTTFAAAGAVAFCASIVLAVVSPELFQVPAQEVRTFQIVIVLLGLDYMISFPGSVFDALLEGSERFDIVNLTSAAFTVLRAVGTVVLLLLGFGIIALAVLEVVSAALGVVVDWAVVRRTLPAVRMGAGRFWRDAWRRVRSFTLWLSANEILAEGGHHFDRLLIAGLLSVALVTPYALAATLATVVLWIVVPASEVLFPIAARHHARGEERSLRLVLLRGTKAFMALVLPIALVITFFGDRILALWVGEGFTTLPRGVLAVLVVNVVLSVFFSGASTILTATERLRPLFILSLTEAIIAIVLVVAAVDRFGLLGIVGGFAVANALVTLALAAPYACRALSVPLRTLLRDGLALPLAAAGPAAVLAWVLARRHPPATWLDLAWEGGLVALVFSLGFVTLSLSTSERALLLRAVRRGSRKTVTAAGP